jgi:hypothetical protein
MGPYYYPWRSVPLSSSPRSKVWIPPSSAHARTPNDRIHLVTVEHYGVDTGHDIGLVGLVFVMHFVI